jgi:hypothetical protein
VTDSARVRRDDAVVDIAPRLTQRLIDAIERRARERVPIAEINRRVGDEAERMGLPRPSYEHVRRLVHESRRLNGGLPDRSELALEALFHGKHAAKFLPPILEPREHLRDRRPDAK